VVKETKVVGGHGDVWQVGVWIGFGEFAVDFERLIEGLLGLYHALVGA
jgi:hypothetical protein